MGNVLESLRHIGMLTIRVAVLLGAIWLAVALYDYIKPNVDNLEVYGRHYAYHFPVSIKREIGKITNEEFREKIRSFSETNSLLVVLLKNKEENEIAGIILEVPFAGISQIVKDEKVISSSEFNRKILVGSMPAGSEIKVVVWTDSWTTAPKGRYDKRYRATYPGSVSYIDFPMEVRGVMASILDYGVANLFILTSVLLLVLTSFIIILMLILRRE
jgi:hypothetical protein